MNRSGGVLYIISGAGGKSLRSIKQLQPYTAAFYSLSYSFTHIEIDGQTLKLRQINQKDDVVDEFVLEKRNRVFGELSGG